MSRVITRCQGCRHQILDTFAALAGISIRPAPQPTRLHPSILPSTSSSRAFSTSHRFLNTDRKQSEPPTTDTQPPAETSPPLSQPSSENNIPWYLQVETPIPPAPVSPLLALQEIPPLPPSPPQILSPILTHLSTTMGLDNLHLIDLRDVHPPPALGANLIMILGTARSYKHLNTSADRFCRWLRSRYKLSPYADGLLGRNEMKLKLRRKARRMKLAQSVGNTVVGQESDDGITTGWVCVNLGSLEGARIPEDEMKGHEQEQDKEGKKLSAEEQEELRLDEEEYENPVDDTYIGFGSRSLAPRIVVQMFTEEKRIEMDLEGLWDVRKQRRSRKGAKADAEAVAQIQGRDEDGVSAIGKVYKPWVQ